MNLFIFLIVVLLGFWIITKIIATKLNIEIKGTGYLYQHVNNIHKWVEIIIVILSVITLFIIGFVYSGRLENHFFLASLIVLYTFRAFMEWKFKKASKKYILSILTISLFLVIFIVLKVFIG